MCFFTELQNYRIDALYSVVRHIDCHTPPKQITERRIREKKKGNCVTISCFFGAQKNTSTFSVYLRETVLTLLTNQFLMTLPFSYLWQNDHCKNFEDKARRKFYKDKKDHDRKKMGTMHSNCKIWQGGIFNAHKHILATGFSTVCKEKSVGSTKGEKCCKPIFT